MGMRKTMRLVSVLVLLVCAAPMWVRAEEDGSARASMPSEWAVLGPLPAGERERGADVLESFGGIWGIAWNTSDTFPSELEPAGRAGWKTIAPETDGSVHVAYDAAYAASFVEVPFGWASWMWRGWATGSLVVHEAGTFLLDCQNVDTFFVGQQKFRGDYYSYGVTASVLTLPAGVHPMAVELKSSVRKYSSAAVSFHCSITSVPDSTTAPLVVREHDSFSPSFVDGALSTPSYATLALLNTGSAPLRVVGVDVGAESALEGWQFGVVGKATVVEAHQLVPLGITIDAAPRQCIERVAVGVRYQLGDGPGGGITLTAEASLWFACVSFGDAARFTYLDYDGSVQYAMATPPLTPAMHASDLASVIVATHGAGVEANTTFWTGSIPRQPRTWQLFPTGRRPWGYDWEGPSRKSTFTALAALAHTLPGVPSAQRAQYAVDTQRVLYIGHSMGGHGCQSLVSHFGDVALGAACAAGFLSIETYVPYNLRVAWSWTDPTLRALLDASIAENNNEIYSPNVVGIPLLLRYGGNDTNVPPWHSRRLARLVDQLSGNATAVEVSEVPGEPHWFPHVLNDAVMTAFYNRTLAAPSLPALPAEFTVTTMNPASFGGRGGLLPLQLHTPFRMGKLRVRRDAQGRWDVVANNVRRFSIAADDARLADVSALRVDGGAWVPRAQWPQRGTAHFCQLERGAAWSTCEDDAWTFAERHPSTYGPLRQVLEADGPLCFVFGTAGSGTDAHLAFEHAVALANTWYTMGRGAAAVVSDTSVGACQNVVLVGGALRNHVTAQLTSPIDTSHAGRITLAATPHAVTYTDAGTGAAFLAPYGADGKQLAAVLAGVDAQGLATAVELFPSRTGMTVGDFVIVSREFAARGASATRAAGYWSNTWAFDATSSFVERE